MKRAIAAVVGLFLLVSAGAAADGLPVSGTYGSTGVVTRDGASRYVTFPSGRDTLVARLSTDGGAVDRYREIGGRFTVPAVAYDGSASGLSTDGRTLVLIRPRVGLGEKRTRFAVLDARRLTVTKRIVLRGDFSFDALSPDGATAYLIEYLSLGRSNFDPTDYDVRTLDLATGKLDPRPIVDPREPDEDMGGMPIARTMSPDARWAYTLYSGSEHPFVHALDTVGRTARCIDLDTLTAREDLFQMRLRITDGGRRLQVLKDDKPQLLVDTRNWAVTEPPPAAAPPRARPQRHAADDGGVPTWAWAAAAGLLTLLAAASARPLARATRAR
jgi:hypothetical protein